MFKAISNALSFLFVMLILKLAFPTIAIQIVEIVLKVLSIISIVLDQAPASFQTR